MTEPGTPEPGWNFAVSGEATEPTIIERIRSALERLWADAERTVITKFFDAGAQGWQASASGTAATPAEHQRVYAETQRIISDPEAVTGSSSFSSPFITATAFHTVPAPAPAAGDGDTADPGQAAPAAGDGWSDAAQG